MSPPLPSKAPLFQALFAPAANPVEVQLQGLHDKCVQAFPESTTRSTIFNDLVQAIDELKQGGVTGALWIDGSFVTTNTDPKDVDVVLCYPAHIVDKGTVDQKNAVQRFNGNLKKTESRLCDSYTFPEFNVTDHPVLYIETERLRAYWKRQFSTDRDGNPKGIPFITL